MIRSQANDDLERIPDDAWTLFEQTDTYRRYMCKIDDHRTAFKTEYLEDEALIAANQQEFNDSIGKRWGDGRVVARVPLNKFFGAETELVARMKSGDEDYAKWWLNSEDARPYRTFRGRV